MKIHLAVYGSGVRADARLHMAVICKSVIYKSKVLR